MIYVSKNYSRKLIKILNSEDKYEYCLVYEMTNRLDEFWQKAEKEKLIQEGTYIINDFNKETQESIKNIEQKQNLTVCQNKHDLYKELEPKYKDYAKDKLK